jgi:hypothetical protein
VLIWAQEAVERRILGRLERRQGGYVGLEESRVTLGDDWWHFLVNWNTFEGASNTGWMVERRSSGSSPETGRDQFLRIDRNWGFSVKKS